LSLSFFMSFPVLTRSPFPMSFLFFKKKLQNEKKNLIISSESIEIERVRQTHWISDERRQTNNQGTLYDLYPLCQTQYMNKYITH
jgi:hypothetical protein